MGFSRQESWSGLPVPFPGNLPDPGIKPGFPTLQADFFYHLSHQGNVLYSANFTNQSNKGFETSDQIRSVAQSCPTLCDPMNRSTPGLPVHHQLPEFTQTHVHRVSDAIQPSYPLSSPSPPAPNPSQYQSLFQ